MSYAALLDVYHEAVTTMVLRLSDGVFVLTEPHEPNDDSSEYLAWLDAGGELEPARPVPSSIVPASATKLGLKRAFAEIGQWDTVKAALSANEDMQEEWDLATEIRRADPLTQAMVDLLEMTTEQVDAILIRAAELVA